MYRSFSVARLPRIEFGEGALERVAGLAKGFGERVLLVTGARSFMEGPHWPRLRAALEDQGLQWRHLAVAGEPSPELVDTAVSRFREADIQVVIGVGGGSALDAAKAVAGLLRTGHSVMDYLEGVGPELPYEGPSVPFLAVPTTAGTGSEATKNAVLSRRGPDGFKKSFRHEQLVAQYAVVDPQLLTTCPRPVLAANGMDALTQLLESYVSTRASPFTDALNLAALADVREALLPLYHGGARSPTARSRMAWAALISGVTLAQTGLGAVHGIAAPLGAFFPIPHGVACGALVAAATAVNVEALQTRAPQSPALTRYARASEVLHERHFRSRDEALQRLIARLESWTRALELPRLADLGVRSTDLDHIVAHSRGNSMRTNPVELTDAEIRAILERSL
ncbi:MAG TPA: iron-containing alcohol dehydrogenase [Chromatiales bacterium]|nr:iron-containing alcohol dehydrogenase [Chromatiales bacterium]